LSLLRELNLIEERGRGSFVLSPRIMGLARAADAATDFRALAQPIIDALRQTTGETALFLRRVNGAAVAVAIAESAHPISISFQPGNLMPLHGGAAAKILLANYPKAKRDQYLDQLSPALGKAARAALVTDLDRIRASGVAESSGEVDEGVWASAAAVEAHGALIGAITVVAPAYRIDDAQKTSIGNAVQAAAAEFSSTLEP
jgi:DNA-binding IclR family transcriptional regulator